MATTDDLLFSGYGLALHTTSPQLGLALSNFQGEEKTKTWELGRDLSTHLHVFLQEFVYPHSWSDLTFIAVAKGPGSFTGTRLGVTTARTLAQQFNLPLFAISTLGAMAIPIPRSSTYAPCYAQKFANSDLIAVQLPARRQQYFVGIYEVTATELIPHLSDTIMTETAWEETLNQLSVPYQLLKTREEKLGETVTSVLALAYQQWQQGNRPRWEEAKPFYGQSPV